MEVFKNIDKEGTIRYKNNWGELHREDGPAVEYTNGFKEWWINGKYHREDGPAVETKTGFKEWFINGLHHREDGPAVEWSDGEKQYWLNGYVFNKSDWEREMMKKKLERIKDL